MCLSFVLLSRCDYHKSFLLIGILRFVSNTPRRFPVFSPLLFISSVLTDTSTFCLHESRGSLSSRRADGEKTRPGGALPSTYFDICVGLKRKIVLYSKPGTDFTPFKEIALNETPLALCWVEHWICVGTRKEYLSIHDEQL